MEPSEQYASKDLNTNGDDRRIWSSLPRLRFWKHIVPVGTLLLGVLVFLFGTDVIGRSSAVPSAAEQSNSHDATSHPLPPPTNVDPASLPPRIPTDSPPTRTHIDSKYSFTKGPTIHPKIISDLLGYVSDTGDQVVAINLLDSQDSNRYHGDIATSPPIDSVEPSWSWAFSVDRKPGSDRTAESGLYPWYAYRGYTWYAYRYVGSTQSGLDVIHARRSSGVAGVGNYVMFIRLELDHGAEYPLPWELEGQRGPAEPEVRHRELIRLVGSISLGDRWLGTVEIDGNDVLVRGRGLHERCESGGVNGLEAAEMKYFYKTECKVGYADTPAPVRRYKAPAAISDTGNPK